MGYEGLYEISSMGRLRSLPRWRSYKNRNPRWIKGGMLKLFPNVRNGYITGTLTNGDRGKRVLIHSLVLKTFVGPRPLGMEVRHFPDQNKGNNNVENLRWGTPKQNQADRVTHGTANSQIPRNLPMGENNHFAKLNNESVRKIQNLLKAGTPRRQIAKQFKVHKDTIKLIHQKKTWRHLL